MDIDNVLDDLENQFYWEIKKMRSTAVIMRNVIQQVELVLK